MPLEGVVGLVVSGIIRVIVKVVVDFTGSFQFRHPYEVRKARALSMQLDNSNHHRSFSDWRVIFFTEHVPAASWAGISIDIGLGDRKSF